MSAGGYVVGTSGYQYDHWVGLLYPPDLPKSRRFEYFAARFRSVEINNTFYKLPSAETVRRWGERAPEGFLFALKFSRYGTHLKRLKDPDEPLERFCEVAEELGDRLGPILVQLPPNWRPEPERLDAFLTAAPDRYQWAVELRDERWLCDEVEAVLREHGAALVIHDLIEDHPRTRTSDWTYLRYHGENYAGSYAHQRLAADADWLAEWIEDGCRCWVYFDNDADGAAVVDAARLERYLARRCGD